MPELKLVSIVSASEAFEKFEASCLLESRRHRPFKGKPGAESNVVVIKLEKEDTITFIDIGNEYTALIEIQVARSTLRHPVYSSLIETKLLMTPEESKKEKNGNKWYRFTKNDFNPSLIETKWDLVKIICKQPFNTKKPYGLSFISLTGGDVVLPPKNVSMPRKRVPTESSQSTESSNCINLNSSMSDENGTSSTESRNKSQDETFRLMQIRLRKRERQKNFAIKKWKDQVQRKKQTLSRNARAIRRNLVKSASPSRTHSSMKEPINPAEISLFNPITIDPEVPQVKKRRGRKRKNHNINPIEVAAPVATSSNDAEQCEKTEGSDEVEWPALYEYLEVEDGVFTELMDGIDINVEQLINIDEHTLLQYEGEGGELGSDTPRYMKVLSKDDDEIVVLKVIPSTHKMSLAMEEKPLIKRGTMKEHSNPIAKIENKVILPVLSDKTSNSNRGKKCRRWNWEKDNYEEVVVSRVSKVGWNVKKNSFWNWDDEWSGAKAVCSKCDLKVDRRRDDNGASLIFRTPNPYIAFNNNLSNIPMSPNMDGDISGFMSDPVVLDDRDGDEINTETLYESMNFDSSGLVDLGYIEDL